MFRISKVLKYSNTFFNNVFLKIDEDIIFKTQKAFNNDSFKNKVDLSIGVYADDNGKLPEASSRYLPLLGDPHFLNASELFIFDKPINNNYKFQTCGGTGALSLANDIINHYRAKRPNISINLPTWPNHLQIFKNNFINSDDMKKNVMLVQTSCHNPTGIEYTDKEKTDILNYAEKENVTIIFDTAYLGLSGDFDNETKFLKMAVERKINFFVCLSYSKIADVYGHRTGALFFRPYYSNCMENINSNVERLIRTNISNSPRYGSDIIMNKYLGSDDKVKNFKEKILTMANRINNVRVKFGNDLRNNNIKNNIDIGKGMFSLLELKPEEILRLQQNYHIYLLPNGRINLCGINNNNYDYVVESIIKNHKEMN
jgi:aspartate/tyrosine/aromatic aminotransferase